MFSSFRRLLKRSKDRELPQERENDSYAEGTVNNNSDNNAANAYIALKLLNHPRPGLAAEISRLRRQHRDLQRRFDQLPRSRPHIRRAKLISALNKMATGSRSVAQPGRNLGRPLTSIDPLWLAAKSSHRIKGTKIPSYRSSITPKTVQKSTSLEAETSLDTWQVKTTVSTATAPQANKEEKTMEAPFKQAANAHRMRRLREWSLTHGQDPTSGIIEGSEQDFAEEALAKIQQGNTDASTTTTVNSSGHRGAAALKDKAWSIMAGLSLETLDKKRGVSAVDVAATAGPDTNPAAERAASAAVPTMGSDRRKTEPMNASQNIARKPSRNPSDGERQKDQHAGSEATTKWHRGSLVGRPRTKIRIQ